MRSKKKLKEMASVSLMTAVECIFAPFTVPIGAIPLSLSTFAVYLSAVLIGKKSFFSVIVYILIGAVGMPVFSGGVGGVDRLFGPTGGFIFGYIPCAVIAGFFAEKFKESRAIRFCGLLLGTALMYVLGSAQLCFVMGADGAKTALSLLAVNVFPFIPIDIAKMILALTLGDTLNKRLKMSKG